MNCQRRIKNAVRRARLEDLREVSEDLAYWRSRSPAERVAAVERPPFLHRDLFDRLIAAEALTGRLPLVTSDRIFKFYGVRVVW